MHLRLLLLSVFICSTSAAELAPMSLKQAQELMAQPLPAAIEKSLSETPKEYSFFNDKGENSVLYIGQTMRNVLISDAKLAFSSMAYGEMAGKEKSALARLNGFYQYNVDEKKSEKIRVKMLNENGEEVRSYEYKYGGLYAKEINLKDKFAGEDNLLRHGEFLGWNSDSIGGVKIDKNSDGKIQATELYEAMMQSVANNATAPFTEVLVPSGVQKPQSLKASYVNTDGLDLSELSQKLLHGAVSFSQAAGDYTSVDLPPEKKKGLLADNETLMEGRPYTVLQHHWDEAFGYFGAARNYLEYTDVEIRTGLSINRYKTKRVFDENKVLQYHTHELFTAADDKSKKDNRYSLGSEKNLGLSINAAKRDLGAALGNEDFTSKTMLAFLRGRQLLQDRPEGYLPYVQAQAVLAVHEWERVIAATVVHYINESVKDLNNFGTDKFKFVGLAKHWSEMKGFAFAFQFNPNSVLFENGTADFLRLHQLMGDKPVNLENGDINSYIDQLLQARDILADAYEFDRENAERW